VGLARDRRQLEAEWPALTGRVDEDEAAMILLARLTSGMIRARYVSRTPSNAA
jgi:hypothetical protein